MRMSPRTVLLALLAVFALSAATAASASASEFVFSKTGTLKGEQVTTQKWKNSLGTFACTKDKVSGSTSVLKSATQKVIVQYEGCTFFGLPMTASAAEFELNTNGTFKLLKAFKLKANFELCTMTFPAQNLKGDTYKNKTGKVEVSSEVSEIVSWGEGSECNYAENKITTFSGTSLIELVGGTMEVK